MEKRCIHTKRYILTGTPGCGKTSIVKELEALGYPIIYEAATDAIAAEQALGTLEPWKHPNFIEKIVFLQKHRQQEADRFSSTLTFFDRSPICTYALCVYLEFAPPASLIEEIERIQEHQIYERQLFFVENLGFIVNTDARKISFEEALKFETMHLEAYKRFGYDCIMVPALPVQKRVKFVLNKACSNELLNEIENATPQPFPA